MFSHIQLGVQNLMRMQQFYDSVLAKLRLVRVAEERVGEAGVIWRRADRRWPQFVLRAPLNALPATWANGSQISFVAPSPDAASAWSVALTLGAINEGEPGLHGRSMLRISTEHTAAIRRGTSSILSILTG